MRKTMSILFKIAEKLITGNNPERNEPMTARQRRAHIKRRIADIEHNRTQGYIYGDKDVLDAMADYFIKAGHKVERYYDIAIRITWNNAGIC